MTQHLIRALALVAVPTLLSAQLPVSSARATGMANAYGAAARGYEAIAWNPALLGLPDRPGFSLNLFQVGAEAGNNSFGLKDFQRYGDTVLTKADKDTLLLKIRDCPPGKTVATCTSTRPLSMRVGLGGTALAMTFGSFGLSVSGAGAVDASLSSDFVELALYGNVTRSGNGQRYLGKGTAANGWAGGTVAVAYGRALPTPVGHLAVGATLKFTQGVAVFRAEDLGTSLQTSPNFDAVLGAHALMTKDPSKNYSNGSGVGLDVGGAYELSPGLRFGLSIENLVGTMSWKDANLVYYRRLYTLTQNGDQFSDSTIAQDDSVPYNASVPAQKALHDSLFAHSGFPTRVRASVRLHTGMLTLLGGADLRVKEGMVSSDGQQFSAGAELLPLGILALRAGFATNFEGGTTLAGGTGLKLGPLRWDVGLTSTSSGDRKGFQVAVGFAIMN